jgi:hypothetical protein
MSVSEKTIEKELCRQVKAIGGECRKWVSPGCTGVPDRIVVLPGGRVHFVELKAPGRSEKPRQKTVIRELQKLGCSVQKIDSLEGVSLFIETVKAERF